jgi:hypothetical protein
MMLHQDGSRHVWLQGWPALDLIATLDDATSAIDSAILVEAAGAASTFRALREVFGARGLPLSLYTDPGADPRLPPFPAGRNHDPLGARLNVRDRDPPDLREPASSAAVRASDAQSAPEARLSGRSPAYRSSLVSALRRLFAPALEIAGPERRQLLWSQAHIIDYRQHRTPVVCATCRGGRLLSG